MTPQQKQALSAFRRHTVRHIDFLGVQLNHAWGNISDERLADLEDEYLRRLSRKDQDYLLSLLPVLNEMLNFPMEAELLSTIFNLEYQEVVEVLRGG